MVGAFPAGDPAVPVEFKEAADEDDSKEVGRVADPLRPHPCRDRESVTKALDGEFEQWLL